MAGIQLVTFYLTTHYVLLKEGTSPASSAAKLPEVIEKYVAVIGFHPGIHHRLVFHDQMVGHLCFSCKHELLALWAGFDFSGFDNGVDYRVSCAKSGP